MATVTLMQFLQNDPNALRYYHRGQRPTTTSNKLFEIAAVREIRAWPEFSLQNIVNRFGNLLNNVQIATDVQPVTPPPRFAAEDYLRELVAIYADRPVRRALASTFEHMTADPNHPDPDLAGRTPTTLGAGSSAKLISKFVPDRAIYDPSLDEPINRLPGEIKPSWKWKWDWAIAEGSARSSMALVRLSQLTFYMLQQGYREPHSGARYGYMLTDQELVAFRKISRRVICMSERVPWGGQQGNGPERLTVLLALWYLGMLASDDDDWNLDAQPDDPTDAQLITQASASSQPARQR
ncbi:hypothetical protein ISF_03863 [Cordyceps fumosorosea ARSEF 2679]|uniref:Uncharacterized protein n=1 Tax=Cordyceps fumosorosea (strain ARSEF 2679) TaxID=1081104 RepID=A0A167Y9M0_CORFA|nr:hypothetical protein ISF_03863 [Cordyceps fumosorosea ARSEF 2679]OAA66025.1 hypothetical protein ISF_03863 [Cordyceps fumosorosea ARSEF 2679]